MISEIGGFATNKQSAVGCMDCEPGAGEVLITGVVFALANKHLECRAVILPSGKLLVGVGRDLTLGKQ